MWGRYRVWTIIILFFPLIIVIFIPYLFPILIPLLILYYSFIRSRAHKSFMMDFARINSFNYQENLPLESVKGHIFSFGHSKKIRHAISCKHNGKNIRIFNYEARTGGGKYQQTHFFTVFEIFFEKIQFPPIVLKVKRRWIDSLQTDFDKRVSRVSLEDEFRKNFSLFCAEGYAIEALQIFKPETLRLLEEKGLNFSIEMIDDRIYVYDRILVSTKKHIFDLYEVAQTVIDSMGPLLSRLSNDFEALHGYYRR